MPKESGEGGSSATGWRKAFAARRGEHRHGNGQDHAQGLRDIPFNKLVLSHSNVLFAHRAALSITAVHEPWNRNPQRLAPCRRTRSRREPRRGGSQLEAPAFLADAEDGSPEDLSDAEEPSHFQLLKPGSLRRAFFVTAQRTASEPAVLKVRGRPERV